MQASQRPLSMYPRFRRCAFLRPCLGHWRGHGVHAGRCWDMHDPWEMPRDLHSHATLALYAVTPDGTADEGATAGASSHHSAQGDGLVAALQRVPALFFTEDFSLNR